MLLRICQGSLLKIKRNT